MPHVRHQKLYPQLPITET